MYCDLPTLREIVAHQQSGSSQKAAVFTVYVSGLHSAFLRLVLIGLEVIVSYVLLGLLSMLPSRIIKITVISFN
jgi:hypothetical protein